VRAATAIPTFDGEHGRRQQASDHPHDHHDFELSVAKRRRVAAFAWSYLVHLLERGGRHADLGHPAQPIIDQPTLEDPLDNQVGRFHERRQLGEPETDVELAQARPARPQVVQHGHRHFIRLHEVFLVQALCQNSVPAALQSADPIVHAAFRYEPLAELHVDRILQALSEIIMLFFQIVLLLFVKLSTKRNIIIIL